MPLMLVLVWLVTEPNWFQKYHQYEKSNNNFVEYEYFDDSKKV